MTLLDALRKIRDEGPINPELGICAQVTALAGGVRGRPLIDFIGLAMDWPKYSGNDSYPVPSPYESERSKSNAAREIYGENFLNSDGLWNPKHPYGALRWELIHWMIDRLETLEGTK